MSFTNILSIWANFNFLLTSATVFNISASSNYSLLFINSNFLLAYSSIWSANVFAFSESRCNLKKFSLDFTEVLDELEKYLEPFDEYLEITEPCGDDFLNLFHEILVFQKIGQWHYFVTLAREALSIFSRNDLQKLIVSWALSSSTIPQYISEIFLTLKAAILCTTDTLHHNFGYC